MITAKPKKEKIGHMPCLNPSCGHTVPVRMNVETKALSFSCQECEFPGYATAVGSEFYRSIIQRMTPITAPDKQVPIDTPPAPLVTRTKDPLFG